MISTGKNFLFVHVPKTGGNSIQKALLEYSDDKIFIQNPRFHDGVQDFEIRNDKYPFIKHSHITLYKNSVEKDIYKNLFKFVTIRNPWDRLISFYFSPHRNVEKWDRNNFLSLLSRVKTLRYYIVPKSKLRTFRRIDNFRYSIGYPGKKLDCEMDYILRYENLQSDFHIVCKKLDIETVDLPELNKSEREHYSYYYDEELKNIVTKKFWEEIKFGNYVFEKR